MFTHVDKLHKRIVSRCPPSPEFLCIGRIALSWVRTVGYWFMSCSCWSKWHKWYEKQNATSNSCNQGQRPQWSQPCTAIGSFLWRNYSENNECIMCPSEETLVILSAIVFSDTYCVEGIKALSFRLTYTGQQIDVYNEFKVRIRRQIGNWRHQEHKIKYQS